MRLKAADRAAVGGFVSNRADLLHVGREGCRKKAKFRNETRRYRTFRNIGQQ
jgi:hypothetical protein